MKSSKQLFGKEGEELAVSYLEKNGYRVIARNFRNRFGEIDIIAYEKKVLCFIEVKARSSLDYGLAVEAVSLKKQKKVSKVALSYLQDNDLLDGSVRFDVIAIDYDDEKTLNVELYKNAFDAV